MTPIRWAWGVALALSSLSAAPLRIEDRNLLNGSFENAKPGKVPNGWTVVRGAAVSDRKVVHDGKLSLRMEATDFADMRVESPPLRLTIGKPYEVRAWVRTEQLVVRDVDRSPIAIGAALSMASLPFDYHSEAIGGTRNWTRLRLRFVATRPEDRIVCLAGSGGEARGKAWFDGISIDEVSSEGEWPRPAAVQTFGAAYRYPKGGWIYLHIEGAPYERGYQHGFLLSKEIGQYLDRCALKLDPKSKERAWELGRNTANALFLRGFDPEILEEMRGIADGAEACGIKWAGRPIDLVDIVAMNTLTEISLLQAALPVTPTGLEGLSLHRPDYFDPKRDVRVTERCSAFAATGKATRDGKMVIGHLTMWPLTLSEQTNIMLDIKPASGHRMLMQSYPGGIQSGTDYYQNDSGIVLAETTIRQSPFDLAGTPVAYRARKAIQYGTSVEDVAEYLRKRNNGLYTNEWLIGDAKTNQIAMFELGTHRSKLYKSSDDEWFGGTEGFYWGCNNAKDLGVRLEYVPDPKGAPLHVPYVPGPRDIKWQELYEQYKGKIDEQFAFLAFRSAPLVTSSAFDAKITTADMASRMMCWAVFGKPNQRERLPSTWERNNYPQITGIYSSGYRLFEAEPSESLLHVTRDREKERLARVAKSSPKEPEKSPYKDRLWKGWILPAADSAVWLTAGSAAYYKALESADWEKEIEAYRAAYRGVAFQHDEPLSKLSQKTTSEQWYELATAKGVLLLDVLRREIGDDQFFNLMTAFFDANTTKLVSSEQFVTAAVKVAPKTRVFFSRWLEGTGLPGSPARADDAAYVVSQIESRLGSTILVYGTVQDAGANRYAAELLQKEFLDRLEKEVPILKDFEVGDDDLRFFDLVFVGRPETNSALARMAEKIGLKYDAASFRINQSDHASENEGLMLARANPLDRTKMVVVVAGNSALETVRVASAPRQRYEYIVFDAGKRTEFGFLKP